MYIIPIDKGEPFRLGDQLEVELYSKLERLPDGKLNKVNEIRRVFRHVHQAEQAGLYNKSEDEGND